ncbi:hypothetical protein AKJ62_04745 [candidate division MSBL1 archaeon SCGC-AAA259D14]|uniref:ASCH domain-containing protein n=2 Tax=candidate division MSBL1 TaxID=215777 RepID=A0A133U377_9EURY|nr:hypothetical protein AKJ62_04745 [candidate division MSBL1 archaeon SCGC-AAA259D14]KXA93728.1 hypothetical protein AKJ66_01290 [candidate division MSBL1 archaeon SCGC-AAA259E22]
MDRLFVPLKTEPFQWFRSGKKKWELRGISSQFNRDTVVPSRSVELRKGYNGESIWGIVDCVETFGSLESVVDNLDFRAIIPPTETRGGFLSRAKELLSGYDEFIAFRVLIEDKEK